MSFFAQIIDKTPVVTNDPTLSWIITVANLGGTASFIILVIYIVIRVWPELRKEAIAEKEAERKSRHDTANGFQKAITDSTVAFNTTIMSVIDRYDKMMERYETKADARLDKVIAAWDRHTEHLSEQIEHTVCRLGEHHENPK